jgi:predicted N-acetyltransferase YhbS
MVDKVKVRPARPSDAEAIGKLASSEFREEPSHWRSFQSDISTWVARKAPILVAATSDEEIVGYCRSKPNEAMGINRSDGQVAVLAQIAVLESHRGAGIGRALHDRTIKTLRMLGYSRVFAQVQETISSWYTDLGWSTFGPGTSVAWIETPIQRDDEWNPHLPPRAFAPILTMSFLPKYPVLAELKIGEARPLVEWTIDARASDAEISRRLNRGLLKRLQAEPGLTKLLPSGLVSAINEFEPDSELSSWLRAAVPAAKA